MALFEKTCACCGKSANILTRTTLADGKTLCRKCMDAIPGYLHNGIKSNTIEAYREIRKYLAYSTQTIKPRFKKTHEYLGLILDANNGYLCINDLASSLITKTLYLQVEDITCLDLMYDPDTYKAGFFSESVNGSVSISLATIFPGLEFDDILQTDVKAEANRKIGLFKDKVEFQNPKGQDEFMNQFHAAQMKFLTGNYGGRYAG